LGGFNFNAIKALGQSIKLKKSNKKTAAFNCQRFIDLHKMPLIGSL
jgi:hypothetical protein